MILKPIPAAVAASLFLAGTPAMAMDAPTRIVSYGDLDLATFAGEARLKVRVHRAARSVCRAQTPDLQAEAASRQCFAEAVADAEPKIRQAVAFARQGRFEQAMSLPVRPRDAR